MSVSEVTIALPEAIRVKSAEFWLKLGYPIQALLELQRLPPLGRKHPWASRVFVTALRTARSYYADPFQAGISAAGIESSRKLS